MSTKNNREQRKLIPLLLLSIVNKLGGASVSFYPSNALWGGSTLVEGRSNFSMCEGARVGEWCEGRSNLVGRDVV